MSLNKSDNNGGFILVFDEINRSWELSDWVDLNTPFSDGLSTADFKPKSREIFIISFDGKTLHLICLGKRKNRVLTLKYKVEFSEFIKIYPPLSIDDVTNNIDKSLRQHFIRSSSGHGKKVSPKTWKALINYIKSARPELSEKINRLIEKQNKKILSGKSKEIEILKRDATTVALHFAAIDSQKAQFSYTTTNTSQELPPFLDGLSQLNLMEDQMLQHDSAIFSDWVKLSVNPSVTAQFKQGNKTLTIKNFNREKVEQLLGVDLLYYHHHYQSYILIQYKKLEYVNGQTFYRIGEKSYKKEYENMLNLEKALSSINSNSKQLKDYRFHKGMCYFKLCEPKILDFHDTSMVKGMYIPLDYWTKLLESEDTKGAKGGKLISYENVGRYFNNTQFVDLVKEGWIGSDCTQSDVLTKIINEILKENRSLIFAELVENSNK